MGFVCRHFLTHLIRDTGMKLAFSLPAFKSVKLLHQFSWNRLMLIVEVSVVTITATSYSNWTEWSTIQGVITRVISKSDERVTRG